MAVVYQLLGFPATGKCTVATAMAEQLGARGEPVALFDNHATANLIWSLVPEPRRFDADVMAVGMTLPSWPEVMDLDITGRSPTQAAAHVLDLGNPP